MLLIKIAPEVLELTQTNEAIFIKDILSSRSQSGST